MPATPTPPPTTPTPPPASTSVTFGGSPTSAPIPSNGAGVTGTLLLPAGSGTATLTAATSLPSASPNPPAIAARGRMATVSATSGGNVGLVYVTLTATGGSVTLNGLPGFSATLPSTAPSGTYYVAYYWTGGQQPAWLSTSSTGIAGGPSATLTIPAATLPAPTAQGVTTPITVAQNSSIYFVVYYGNYIPPINIFGCVGVQSSQTADRLVSTMLSGVHPITGGNAFNYTGTLAQSIVRSQPCPQPTATANANVTLAVTMTSATNEHSVEQDAYTTNTTQLTTDATVALNSGIYTESQETSTDLAGNQTVTTYSPALQYAVQSEPATGGCWTGTAPATVNQTAVDGTLLQRQYNTATGGYTETDTFPGGVGTNTITVNSDYSGSYNLGNGTKIAISAPSAGTVTATITPPSGSPTSLTYGDFIEGAPLYSDATADKGTVGSLPSGCALPSGASSPIEQLVRTIQIDDPVLGYTETETVTTYDLKNGLGSVSTAVGPICTQISDVLQQYIDYSLTTPYLAFFSPNATPLQTNTISETLGLNATGNTIMARPQSSGGSAYSPVVSARLSSIRFTRNLERLQMIEAIDTYARSHSFFGGVK